jgi:hypothetical protein
MARLRAFAAHRFSEAGYRQGLRLPKSLCMRQRLLSVTQVLDKHRVTCPRCRCPEAVVLIDGQFNLTWQCTDCEIRWPASDEETTLLLGSAWTTIH